MSDGAAALERLRALTDDALAALDFGEAGRRRRRSPRRCATRCSPAASACAPCSAWRRPRASAAPPGDALPTALALELVHTFSLVHDDLPALDDDALRRGRPTAHVRYGEDIAVLAGDALLNHAFALVCDRQDGSDARRVAALRELTSAVGLLGMIGGQYRDVRPEDALDARGLERTSRLKTGALLGACRGLRSDRGRRRSETTSPRRAPSASSSACSSRSSTTCSTRPAATRRSASRPAPTPAAAAARSRASSACRRAPARGRERTSGPEHLASSRQPRTPSGRCEPGRDARPLARAAAIGARSACLGQARNARCQVGTRGLARTLRVWPRCCVRGYVAWRPSCAVPGRCGVPEVAPGGLGRARSGHPCPTMTA